ncbi:conserved hypothetical protein [Candidatus Propionivibrio aalborgensis]|uniref:Uncharacterized protein n=2 Tax=Candidatus Propionivibrio aalborgensis TaxID=1860101 RepID=A0A1A8Y1C4_9RHOO|nr:conserved hypothetical protein [Candidatus Propionivibrio aalborgensis]
MMGILDWFKNRPGQFDPDRVSDEMIQGAVEKAIALTNPRLKLLPDCYKRLTPAVETTIEFLCAQVAALPAAHPLSAKAWSSDPALRAFFVAPTDIQSVLGRSENLRTLFDKFPELDEALVILGMAINKQRVFGMALHGDMVQRDVAQTSVSFSDHRARLCGRDEARLRRIVGVEVFEHLVAQALSEIGEERVERQELQASRSLIRTRLRLLQKHGPGLGSMFGADPAAPGEQTQLEASLLENERQLHAIGGGESVLEAELECLKEVLGKPESYLRFEPTRLRLSPMNVMLEETSTATAADVEFVIVELSGATPQRRAITLERVARTELPPPQKLNFDHAARYL